jgi:hypothetical protein
MTPEVLAGSREYVQDKAGLMATDGDVDAVARHCRDVLGPSEDWVSPAGYPDSLALCVLDATWSIGINYQAVKNILTRYRRARHAAGCENPGRDDLEDLRKVIAGEGGPKAFADTVANRQRTSTRGGILKAEAVERACQALIGVNIRTVHDLRVADVSRLTAAEQAWLQIRGQGSGLSWRYLLMLTGRQDVKPDRMVIGFVKDALGHRPTAAQAADLVQNAAAALRAEVRTLDHRIWQYQRTATGRTSQRR